MRQPPKPNYLLRLCLLLTGTMIIVLGLNVGFGGIRTLGWQGGVTSFLDVTDPALYSVRDSHIRFIGGVWLALGAILLAGGIAFQRLRPILVALVSMIFVGGVVRLASGDFATLFSVNVGPSLVFELVAAPLLAAWLHNAERWTAPGDEATLHTAP